MACLREGMFSVDRDFARKSLMSSLRRDESQTRLSARFCMVTGDLDRRIGVFGSIRGCQGDADDITDVSSKMFARFATSNVDAPYAKNAKPETDIALDAHIRTIHKQLLIDAASNEQLSGRQMEEARLASMHFCYSIPNRH